MIVSFDGRKKDLRQNLIPLHDKNPRKTRHVRAKAQHDKENLQHAHSQYHPKWRETQAFWAGGPVSSVPPGSPLQFLSRLPSLSNCDQDVWAEINPFLFYLLLDHDLYHSNKKLNKPPLTLRPPVPLSLCPPSLSWQLGPFLKFLVD